MKNSRKRRGRGGHDQIPAAHRLFSDIGMLSRFLCHAHPWHFPKSVVIQNGLEYIQHDEAEHQAWLNPSAPILSDALRRRRSSADEMDQQLAVWYGRRDATNPIDVA